VGRIELGTDADNVRTDGTGQVFVGHGSGAIAVIEAASRRKLADIALPDHPEGFQLRPSQIFVNVPAARAIAVVDRVAQKQIAAWRVPNIGGNFPMALDRKAGRVFAVFRHPPTLVMLDGDDGRVIARASSCGDADDVFVDAKRRQIYVSCGDGAIGVFALGGDNIAARGSVATGSGARTSLFVPERDRLYLAVPSHGSEPAAIWVFRPLP
jgi:hypothetical protein